MHDKARQQIHTESMMVSVGAGPQLHMRRFCADRFTPGTPVLMIHGLVEDGHIFYSNAGSGLAWYLAAAGYDVYAADLRSRGKSWPGLNAKSADNLHETINADLPALQTAIVRRRGPVPQIWINHAWGGVLSSSYFARHGACVAPVQAMVYFGTRRYAKCDDWRKKWALKGFWQVCLLLASRFRGYVPAKEMRVGTASEARPYFSQSMQWTLNPEWLDPEDQHDYSLSAKTRTFPPSLYFASESDSVYGVVDDVRTFIASLGDHDGRLIVLSKRGGNANDYGHVDMLSDRAAEEDHFPVLLEWLRSLDEAAGSFSDDSLTPLKTEV
ncbi:MAG: alpha/beta fold hydrolase [Pseudomonadales bacterium]